MPLYNYECPGCGEFTLVRSLVDRNLPASCPACHQRGVRVLSAPNLSLMPGNRREAHARNEKSCHEPGTMTRHRCGTGCGCGTSSKGTPKAKQRKVNLGRAGVFEAPSLAKRPWMLGH